MWSKKERFLATLAGEKTDFPPISAWRHFIESEHSGPHDFAQAMIKFQQKYQWDFIKLQPRAVYYEETWGNVYNFENYDGLFVECLNHLVHEVKDLEKIVELKGNEPVLQEQIDGMKGVKQAFKTEDVPVLQSIFTPAGILMALCQDPNIGRYREAPREKSLMIRLIQEDKEMVHRALGNIAKTMAKYCEHLVEEGVDGIFYAALGLARTGFLTEDEWMEFVRPYDLLVLESLKKVPVLLHTCGIYSNPERFVDYPIQAIHWPQSAPGNPTLKGSKAWLKGKIAMGGVDERLFGTHGEKDIYESTRKAVLEMKDQPFLLTPDCSLAFNTYDEELLAFFAASREENI